MGDLNRQQSFFYIIEKDPAILQGTVQQVEGERYLALIAGGWWMAYGKTEKEAVKRVTKKYNDEMYVYRWGRRA